MFQRISKVSFYFDLRGRATHRVRATVTRHACALLLALAMPAVTMAAGTSPGPLLVEVDNPLRLARPDEVLELPLAEVWRQRPTWRALDLVVREARSGRLLQAQRYASDGGAEPDQLLVQLDIGPHGARQLEIAPAQAKDKARVENGLYARNVPERDDDFAWENTEVAYRIYGPALAAKGEVSSGIDVWSKRPPRWVIDDWYRRDAEGQSYHVDHGDGLDSYAVGHSPGAGGTAAWVAGSPVYSSNASRVRITAMGPIRLRFEVDYAPWRAGVATVHEHKVITLDDRAHMNRQAVTYRFDGASSLSVIAGVAVHDGATVAHRDAARIAVWDTPQKASAGRIATAIVVPSDAGRYVTSEGAAWALFDVPDGGTIRFASGAGWSKGDVPDFDQWQRQLGEFRQRWMHPLHVRWLASP